MEPVPVRAWSAALLPTGKVLLFHDGERMHLWDPADQQFGERFAANTNLFCAGLSLLADGHLLAVGGHAGMDEEEHFLGIQSAEVFDPWQERWTQLPDMVGGERWYPTAVTLSDGRVLVASGTHAGETNDAIELLDPTSEERTVITRQPLPVYPWAATRPGGEVVFYGPGMHTARLEWESGTFWEVETMSADRWGGAGALLNGKTGELLAVGGGDSPTRTAEIYDPDTAAWQSIVSMVHPRHHPDLVLLPDGCVLVVGGHRSEHEDDDGHEGEHDDEGHEDDVLRAAILDRNRTRWEAAGQTHYGHGYHSTALLLPDGNVLAAGPEKTLEIYHPWYASVDDRPTIIALPDRIDYEETFPVTTGEDTGVARVVLIRTSSVTHSLNTDQRYLELEFEAGAEGALSVQGPASRGVAPPGYYLLFVVNDDDVPSEGEFLQIG